MKLFKEKPVVHFIEEKESRFAHACQWNCGRI